MNIYAQLILIPLIAGAIGWVTNKVAVLMLFHPKEPVRFLGLTIQGIFPKRQLDIAERMGEMVAEDLLSHHDIKQRVFTEDNIGKVKEALLVKLEKYLEHDLKEQYPIVSTFFIGSKARARIKEKVLSEIDQAVIDLQDNFEQYLSERVNVKEMVVEKIAGLDLDEVNDLMTTVMKNELQFIEWVGATLGFIIGLIQVLLVNLL